MYEVVVTRLLSVISWYYLAFVSVSMAMLGMTAGALFVQLRSHFFTEEQMPKRLWQAAFAMAISLPLALVTMQSIPIDVDFSLQMFYSFVLFSAVMAVPFFFSGVAICLALTRSKFPIGKVYSVDLFGAAAGSLCAVGLLELMDPSSAVFAVSALTFVSAAAWARYEGGGARTFRFIRYGLALAIVAAFNAASPSAFRPLWCKGQFNKRDALAAEVWNPISGSGRFSQSTPFNSRGVRARMLRRLRSIRCGSTLMTRPELLCFATLVIPASSDFSPRM